MAELLTTTAKIASLSPELRAEIVVGERKYVPDPRTPVSNFLVHTKRHCNGGRTVDAGLWLRDHCDQKGRIFLTMAGAGSSFQMGIMISELIRAGKIAGISVTGANLEESLYRALAYSHYAYIPRYEKLTEDQEVELDHAGLRRITDTFLPEEESVRLILPQLEKLWREAEATNTSRFWVDFFFELFERRIIPDVVPFDSQANPEDCWLYQAWLHKVPVFVPGPEDSTMGNIFSYFCYGGEHPFLKEYKQKERVNPNVVRNGFEVMHHMAEWYMSNATHERGFAFLQLGGGIAADFPICVVPHLKKDYLVDESIDSQEKLIPPWAAFIEIGVSPMSAGSYSMAGGDEKKTWSKLMKGAFVRQIFGDYTGVFPDMAALVLRK